MKEENKAQNKIDLETIGWNSFFKESFSQYKNQEFIPGRITQVQRKNCIAFTEIGEINAKVSGKFRFNASEKGSYPAVGDWVAIKKDPKNDVGLIQAVLPRKSKISRKVIGKITQEQVIVANVDIIWIVVGLDNDFSIERIERYLTLVSESGANPVIILNKSDLCTDINKKIEEVRNLSPDVPIHELSAELNQGLNILNQYLVKSQTIALVGSSGAGKSTIINKLLGIDRQKVGAVRESDSRGRHITTYREMIIFPTGGIIIDNPGMKEIQLWFKGKDLADTFKDIEDIALSCKFTNCNHKTEPGCAVKSSLESGDLNTRRYQHYLTLNKEAEKLAIRQEQLKKKNAKQPQPKRF